MYNNNAGSSNGHTGRMTDLIPWAIFVAPGVVLNKDGSLQQTIRFRGRDFTSSSSEDLAHACSKLNNACRRFGSGWVMYVEAVRSKTTRYLEKTRFPDRISQLVEEERRIFFEDSQQTYLSEYYFTLQYYPPEESARKTKSLFFQGEKNTKDDAYKKVVEQFKSHVLLFSNLLSELMYETRFLDCDETLTVLHGMISDSRHPVKTPPVADYFDRFICDAPLENGMTLKLGGVYLKTISITGYPSASFPALLERLNGLPLEYRWVSRYIPMSKMEAEQVLKGYRRRWFAKRKSALSMLFEVFSKNESALQDSTSIKLSRDADEAMQELMADYVSYGYLTITITLMNKDPGSLEASAHEVERTINSLGFTTVRENINALESWLSSIHGHAGANVRMPLLHSLNLCHLLPLCAPWSGAMKNEHLQAPALMLTHTSGSSPFYLNNHIHDVGHQLILGPTGSGKSVLLNMMALQFLRYENAQVIIFDKGLSFLVSTLSTGGRMYSMGMESKNTLQLQPLVGIDDEDERMWCHEWLLSCCLGSGADGEQSDMLWSGLSLLAGLAPEHRNLTNLCTLIQDERLVQDLLLFTEEGTYGQLLDGKYEPLSDSNWLYFEMERLMGYTKVLPAILMYLFHLLDKRFTGRPTLLILDEAWLFLDNRMFANHVREWLKTLRKKNVSVIFATQSVDDLIRSDISSALVESCPSRIFLPNKRAEDPHITSFYEELGLNGQQIRLIASITPKRDYYYQSTQGNALFDLCLGPVALAFADSQNMARKKQILELYDAHGYPKFIKKYLELLDMQPVADLLLLTEE